MSEATARQAQLSVSVRCQSVCLAQAHVTHPEPFAGEAQLKSLQRCFVTTLSVLMQEIGSERPRSIRLKPSRL